MRAVLLSAVLVLAACQVTRTPHDDIRSSCVAAANAHQLAIKRALAGEMKVDTFVAIDEAWDVIAYDCSLALGGGKVADGAPARVRSFNEKYGPKVAYATE